MEITFVLVAVLNFILAGLRPVGVSVTVNVLGTEIISPHVVKTQSYSNGQIG